jgi:hypothetical protein
LGKKRGTVRGAKLATLLISQTCRQITPFQHEFGELQVWGTKFEKTSKIKVERIEKIQNWIIGLCQVPCQSLLAVKSRGKSAKYGKRTFVPLFFRHYPSKSVSTANILVATQKEMSGKYSIDKRLTLFRHFSEFSNCIKQAFVSGPFGNTFCSQKELMALS